MPGNLHWNDQPKELEGTECVLRFTTDGRIIEVRHAHGRWYITQGNLFGSQSVACPDVLTALRLANEAANVRGRKGKDAGVKLPDGCTLMAAPPKVPA